MVRADVRSSSVPAPARIFYRVASESALSRDRKGAVA